MKPSFTSGRPGKLGRVASIVIRYDDETKLEAAAKFFQRISRTDLPPEPSAGRGKVYSLPFGNAADVELRLVYPDGEADSKGKTTVYYQVDGHSDSDEAARQVLSDAVAAVLDQSGGVMKPAGEVESDAAGRPTGDPTTTLPTYRVVLTDGDDTQIGLLVNPPFPRGGGVTDGSKVFALLTAVFGLGALLFGGIELFRRR